MLSSCSFLQSQISIDLSNLLINRSTIFSWKNFNNYIVENETDNSIVFITFSEKLSFEKYYNGNSPLIGLYTKDDKLSLEERIVRFNWNTMLTSDEELQEWFSNKLENNNNPNKIFLIQQFEGHTMMSQLLFDNGWLLSNGEKIDGHFDYYLYEFNIPVCETTTDGSVQ